MKRQHPKMMSNICLLWPIFWRAFWSLPPSWVSFDDDFLFLLHFYFVTQLKGDPQTMYFFVACYHRQNSWLHYFDEIWRFFLSFLKYFIQWWKLSAFGRFPVFQNDIWTIAEIIKNKINNANSIHYSENHLNHDFCSLFSFLNSHSWLNANFPNKHSTFPI